MNDPNALMPPYPYLYYNHATSMVSPSTVHVADSALSHFFRRYLFQRVLSVFKWKIPKHWAENYFLTVLYSSGYVAVINTAAFGVIPQWGSLTGYNVFYQPTHVIISNPLIPMKEYRIGGNCEIIMLSPDYIGVHDLVSYYGDQLALSAQALGMNLVNSKLAFAFMAGSKAGAETLKKIYDEISSGNPAVFFDNKALKADGSVPWQFFQQNLSQNHIAGDILDEMRTIIDMFDTEIGIPNANTQKKERLNVAEVNSNNVETLSKASLWMDTMKKGIDKVNAKWDLGLAVEWRFRPEGPLVGGVDNGTD